MFLVLSFINCSVENVYIGSFLEIWPKLPHTVVLVAHMGLILLLIAFVSLVYWTKAAQFDNVIIAARFAEEDDAFLANLELVQSRFNRFGSTLFFTYGSLDCLIVTCVWVTHLACSSGKCSGATAGAGAKAPHDIEDHEKRNWTKEHDSRSPLDKGIEKSVAAMNNEEESYREVSESEEDKMSD